APWQISDRKLSRGGSRRGSEGTGGKSTARRSRDAPRGRIRTAESPLNRGTVAPRGARSLENCAVGARSRRSRKATGAGRAAEPAKFLHACGAATLAWRACQEKERGGGELKLSLVRASRCRASRTLRRTSPPAVTAGPRPASAPPRPDERTPPAWRTRPGGARGANQSGGTRTCAPPAMGGARGRRGPSPLPGEGGTSPSERSRGEGIPSRSGVRHDDARRRGSPRGAHPGETANRRRRAPPRPEGDGQCGGGGESAEGRAGALGGTT
ncbi:hypothetical protein THAOC_14651, partial [Thalassiosira oceanica]